MSVLTISPPPPAPKSHPQTLRVWSPNQPLKSISNDHKYKGELIYVYQYIYVTRGISQNRRTQNQTGKDEQEEALRGGRRWWVVGGRRRGRLRFGLGEGGVERPAAE